jgi:hypothetical protein
MDKKIMILFSILIFSQSSWGQTNQETAKSLTNYFNQFSLSYGPSLEDSMAYRVNIDTLYMRAYSMDSGRIKRIIDNKLALSKIKSFVIYEYPNASVVPFRSPSLGIRLDLVGPPDWMNNFHSPLKSYDVTDQKDVSNLNDFTPFVPIQLFTLEVLQNGIPEKIQQLIEQLTGLKGKISVSN